MRQYAFSLYCALYVSWDGDKENLMNNQKFLKLVIISFILGRNLIFDSGVTL